MRKFSDKSKFEFGEFSFLTGMTRKETIKAYDFCKLIKIKRNDFINLIKNNESEFEKFCLLKDNILEKISDPSKKIGLVEIISGKSNYIIILFI
jgi:hypothetical protein